ncbi:MAG: DJ-1/PfpI family protein [Clostridia bacterium]|nr:DJ-1/PfpI family protein [Clostridia bacterium]
MIYMFLANGFEEIEALCPLDLMRRVGLDVKTVGVSGKYITGSHGITVEADMTADELADNAPTAVILPGGMPGTTNLDASPVVHRAIDDANRAGALVAAICAAPMILGQRGDLRGKEAIAFPGFEKYLDGATISARKVVTDGRHITAAGMGVALEFGLAIVSYFCGAEKAAELKATVQA